MIRAAVRARPAVAMSVATGASRMSGLLRTVALATALGVTAIGDSYNTANTLPNMVFTLVVGGVLTSAVVPVLVAADTEGEGPEAAGALLGMTLVVGIAASVIVAIGAPLLVRLLTTGAESRSDYEDYVRLTTTWLWWFAPQIGLYAAGVLAVSIMTAKRKLFVGAAAPIVTNIVTIGVALSVISVREASVGSVSATHVTILGAGTTAAVAAAAFIQVWGAYRTVPELKIRWSPRHPAVRRLGRRAGWMILYVGCNQVGLVAIIAIATATAGGVSAYTWAFLLMQLPYALVTVSVVSAAYADISRAAHEGRSVEAEVHRVGSTSLSMLIPASVGLAFVAVPLATVVVGNSDAPLLATAIGWFALSLVPFATFQLLTRVSYAHNDTRSPALTNILVNGVNIAGALILVAVASSPSQRVQALVVAHGLSYIAGVLLLASILIRRNLLSWPSIVGGQRSAIAAAVLMGVVLWGATTMLDEPQGRADAILYSGGLMALGVAVYVAALWTSRFSQRNRVAPS